MSWLNKLMAQTLPAVPKPIVRRVSSRYIAGETLPEALSTVQGLNGDGCRATLDILGEFVNDEAEARTASDAYVGALDAIRDRGLDTNVSLKLTQLGLKLDLDLCHAMTRRVVESAVASDNFVRLDMEDSTCTEDTLEIFRRLHAEFPRHVGCVIQAYLRRSEGDVRGLVAMGANVRLCKGIYIEPPTLAFRDPAEVNRSFVNLLTLLLEGGSYAGIATHDDALVDAAYDLIKRLKLAPEQYEFQMLLGVREPLRRAIVAGGHRLRVYVPFGPHWHAYSLRRLKENPKIAGYVLKAFLNGRS
jgi:proline dehydrogenase